MHASFAWCLPSKPRPEFTETFGIAVAEKMLAGGLGPVITTRTGGIPEASGGHCLEHEAGNADDLCGCLDRAFYMTDAERRELSACFLAASAFLRASSDRFLVSSNSFLSSSFLGASSSISFFAMARASSARGIADLAISTARSAFWRSSAGSGDILNAGKSLRSSAIAGAVTPVCQRKSCFRLGNWRMVAKPLSVILVL